MKITLFRPIGLRRLVHDVRVAVGEYATLCRARVTAEVARCELLELQAREVRERIAATGELYELAKRLGTGLVKFLAESGERPN